MKESRDGLSVHGVCFYHTKLTSRVSPDSLAEAKASLERHKLAKLPRKEKTS